MKLLYKILKQDPASRDGAVTVTSALNIIVNLLIAGLKVVIGTAVNSIAIISEGINNLTDALSSILAIVGTKLSARRPTDEHPFGFGRIEYLTSLIIAGLIVYTGIELIKDSVELILHPEGMAVSTITLVIVAVTALIKLVMGTYTINVGKKVEANTLIALGTDCRNDSLISVVTILSAVIFLVFNISVDAYAGIIISVVVLKAGYGILKETLGDLLGRAGDKELARKLYREIRATEGIVNAADMMLHSYGPDAYSGSVNVEMSHEMTVGEVYDILHRLQLRIMHEMNVTMVFGIYAVDNTTGASQAMRREIGSFVKAHEHVKSFHALYIDNKSDKIYCDLIVDYQLKEWDRLREEFTQYMKELYPDRELELVIETEFV